MFRKIDDLIIDKVFQPMADYIYTRHEKTNFWLAAELLTLMLVMETIRMAGRAYEATTTREWSEFGWLAFYPLIVLFIVTLRRMYLMSDRKTQNNSVRTMSEFRLSQYLTRMLMLVPQPFFLALVASSGKPMTTLVFVGNCYSVAFIASLYFAACAPGGTWAQRRMHLAVEGV